MKAARLEGPGNIQLQEIPSPNIPENEVFVEVKYCGICGIERLWRLVGHFTLTASL